MVRAQDWYAIEAPEQVERFADELAAAIERIRARPLLFAALRQESPTFPSQRLPARGVVPRA